MNSVDSTVLDSTELLRLYLREPKYIKFLCEYENRKMEEYFSYHFYTVNISLKGQNFKKGVMSLAGFPAPKERSKFRHSVHRRNLQESEQDLMFGVV